MRIVVHGQQAFGKAVLEALLKRGENVVAVYAAPDKEGQKPDPIKDAAQAAKLPLYQPKSYRKPGEVWDQFRALKPDLCVMAYVTLFVPSGFLNIPTHGSITAAAASRPVLDQLADPPGPHRDRAVDLLAG
jgi:methionyl-tRNA formyltransferase